MVDIILAGLCILAGLPCGYYGLQYAAMLHVGTPVQIPIWLPPVLILASIALMAGGTAILLF